MLKSASRGGVSLPGLGRGFSLPGPGGVCSRGGFLPVRGGLVPGGFSLLETPPVNRMTDRCKNITLATTSLRPVMMTQKRGSIPFTFDKTECDSNSAISTDGLPVIGLQLCQPSLGFANCFSTNKTAHFGHVSNWDTSEKPSFSIRYR